ncbi:hypothetical protein COCCADRAFT_5541 [Bipolaris zeicola 26-R-13]|uniref:Uncharacterized protein n=1 Tax=Cochliobolus carbonum (strain 26-R-13) TaxID=930089 RepID=W6XZE5_COCC2|nr:uncharacterized protein COCCADRAFT_5541 [Bipolaris zeicola 26-R-13]EUC32857.1 hypothetical protein COCCADRAFT_5541 [Bipolaris zeicola 26-R-13]
MLLEAPPPRRQVSSAPVSLSAASAVLEKYLQDSETHAHLHPDALITPDGVTFNAKGGAVGNLLMHHLRRVAAGLRGEYLEPDTTLEAQDEALDTAADGEGSKNTGAEQDWQDKATYQAELGGIEIGDVGNRTNVVQGGQEPPVQTNDTKKRKKDQAHDHDHNQQSPADGQVDKDARKKAKKERDLQRKRDNAAKAKKSD